MAATANETTFVGQIGESAGVVWHYLEANGPTTFTKLVKEIDLPRDTVMQAIGWLGREDKITVRETPRSKIVSLHS